MMNISVPIPTPIYRFIHVENLGLCLQRRGLHAPNRMPHDKSYKTIHNVDIQRCRRTTAIPCGPSGVIHDYVPFYFGYLSPMMLQLKTGQVQGYEEGQEPLIYLVSTAQAVVNSGSGYVFSDGHGIAAYTNWYNDLSFLDRVDWSMVNERYWHDTTEDMDRQRRKQAEFLVYCFCDWSLIQEIAVINRLMKRKAEDVMSRFPPDMQRDVRTKPEWYYN